MKLKPILLLIILLPFLWGCNDEDDINAIFSGTWKLNNFYRTDDWKDDNSGTPIYPYNSDELKEIITGKYRMSFSDRSFTAIGSTELNNLAGTWTADGKKNTINFVITVSTNESSVIGKHFFEAIKNAAYYSGDINFLKLYPEDRKTYIQFKRIN